MWTKFNQKGYLWSKAEIVRIATEFPYSNQSSYEILTQNNNFDFWDQIC